MKYREQPIQRPSPRPVTDWRGLLDAALGRRAGLLGDPHTTAIRLFNDAADGIDGLVLERFGDVLIAQLHEQRLSLSEPEARELCEQAAKRVGSRAVYRKIFASERSTALPRLQALHTDPQPWIGQRAEEEFDVLENGARFRIRPHDGYSVGLFLDQRENRARVRERAAGRVVLNAFAYTCGFSVAAALGGAAATVSVDVSKRYLEWGKRNFAANALGLEAHTFICSDVLEYFRRAARQKRTFDLVILDPPTFARSKQTRSVFTIAQDLDRLLGGAVERLNPGGWLLMATNHRGTSRLRLEKAALNAAGGRAARITDRPALPPDFAGDPDYSKSIWMQVDG